MSTLPALDKKLAVAQEAFRNYQNEAAMRAFRALLESDELDADQHCLVTCRLAECCERLDQFAAAAAWLAPYDDLDARADLAPATQQALFLRLSSSHTNLGGHPTAISYAKQALALAEAAGDLRVQGAAYLALGKTYRLIGQTPFARDHFQESLRLHRSLGDRLLMAQSYAGLGIVAISEGEYLAARNYLSQALQLMDEGDEPALYANVCTNLAVVSQLQEEGSAHERVGLLERAANIYRKLGKDKHLARAYSNLGYLLSQIGELSKAREFLSLAIAVGRDKQAHAAVANAYETLGEVAAIAGDYAQSRAHLDQALEELRGVDQFNESQVLLTTGRLLWMEGRYADARSMLRQAREVSEKIENHHVKASAQLYQAQVACDAGDLSEAEALLAGIAPEVETLNSISVLGHLRLAAGRLSLAQGRFDEAANVLRQATSIFELSSNLYLRAVAGFLLAETLRLSGRVKEARDEAAVCHKHFTTMQAAPMLARLNDWLQHPEPPAPEAPAAAKRATRSAHTQLSHEAVNRLLGATASRDLLLHELARVVCEEPKISGVAIYEKEKSGAHKLLAYEGCQVSKAIRLMEQSGEQPDQPGAVVVLRPGREQPLYLGLSGTVGDEARFQLIVKAAELGLELCALRRKLPVISEYERGGEASDLTLPGMVYSSQAMRDVAEQIHKIHGSKVSVLVTGESGTGKEGIARSIHALSKRSGGPFIAFNCSVVSPELIDSQLFGHRKGSFTGADNNYLGWIRSAEGGTLFLDEIGEMSLEAQPKLLRFLQEGEIHPVGETKPIKVDVRVIAATNRDLESFVAQGKFREDLYYRLNVIRLHVPALRERREEVPLLAQHLLERFGREAQKSDLTLAPEVLDLLMTYDWPGNIRQVANEIQRIVALMPDGGTIRPEHLSAAVRQPRTATGKGERNDWMDQMLIRDALRAGERPAPGRTLAASVEELEKRMISEALARLGGNILRTAEELGLTRKGLYMKIERYQINLSRFKTARVPASEPV